MNLKMEEIEMIDFIKAHTRVNDPVACMKKADPDFFATLNYVTGEIKFPLVTSFCNIEIEAYESGLVYFSGSPHKFKNGGKNNFDDFTFPQITEVLHVIFDRFEIPFNQIKLENIEFGVNITPPIETNTLLDGIVLHGRSFFEYIFVKDGKYKQAAKSDYYLKAYNKGKQQCPDVNLFRWEIKFKRMRLLKKLAGLSTLNDLLDHEKLKKISPLLISRWNEILFIDPTIEESLIPEPKIKKYLQWINQNYWRTIIDHCRIKDVNKFSRELKSYREFQKKYSAQIQDIISDLISEKIFHLLDDEK